MSKLVYTLLTFICPVFFIGSAAFSAASSANNRQNQQNQCRELFTSVTTEKWFLDVPHSLPFPFVPLQAKQPLAIKAIALQKNLSEASEKVRVRWRRQPWVAGFQITKNFPQNVDQALDFGHLLVQVTLNTFGFENHKNSVPIFVSAKDLSLEEIVSKVLERASIYQDVKTQENIESQIEMIAATVGPPAERMVLYSTTVERTGSIADVMGPGLEIDSIAIINRRTGLSVMINLVSNTIMGI